MKVEDPAELETARKARSALLSEEADGIHFANQLYWKRKDHSLEASAEHEHRQERLEEITRQLRTSVRAATVQE
jgi:hypothetical protein